MPVVSTEQLPRPAPSARQVLGVEPWTGLVSCPFRFSCLESLFCGAFAGQGLLHSFLAGKATIRKKLNPAHASAAAAQESQPGALPLLHPAKLQLMPT